MSDELAAADMPGIDPYDPVQEIIQDEVRAYIQTSLNTCLAGLGGVGDEPAQREIVEQVKHLHLAEPWLPAVAAVRRLRLAGLLASGGA